MTDIALEPTPARPEHPLRSAAERGARRPRHGGSRARRRGAGVQRASGAGRFGAPAAPPPARAVPVPVRASPSPTTPASTTPRRIAAELAAELDDVRVVRLEQKGRGRALHAVWSTSDAPVLAYMDVDLSTDLAALAPLVAPLISGHSDLAIGTRLGRGARVVRGPKREIISRCYNLILKSALRRALLRRAVRVQGDPRRRRAATAAARRRHRLVLRHRAAGAGRTQRAAHPRGAGGLGRRSGQPGRHRGDRGRRPQGHRAAAARLRRRVRSPCKRLRHSSVRPGARPRRGRCCARRCGSRAIGVASTVAYLLLFMMLHGWLGAQVREPDRPAGHRDRQHRGQPPLHLRRRRPRQRGAPPVRGTHRVRHRAGITSGALATLHAVVPEPGRCVELTVLVAANLLATVVRFVLLRGWVFHPRRNH